MENIGKKGGRRRKTKKLKNNLKRLKKTIRKQSTYTKKVKEGKRQKTKKI